ncbi:MAG: hypothetical protein FVQ80_03630 [Planctomycetes bacterium]|nr:hypothetical protein [Planctomycetota bacterium]
MPERGSDIEILEFAIAREVEAHHFFLALAERVESSEMREVFEDFAAEELEHKEKLELEMMKAGIVVDGAPSDVPRHEHVISEDGSMLDMDYKDMLLLAMEKEEASFRAYINLIQHIHEPSAKETLLVLAEEEVKHKLRFKVEYDLLLKQS